ncbi:hypothetical protein EZV62_007309 [Acer yangbiense]|uniref:Uncharacterized protein n=1 Tax=Acer yangbiense TaxID=1000413 RepID=A0A5C7IA25_9ROSI|nr:hypothetical protein EZV62_007309 [Acer yangbiense]
MKEQACSTSPDDHEKKMVRKMSPCCEKMGLKKDQWTPEEDQILISFIHQFGHPNWRALPKQAGFPTTVSARINGFYGNDRGRVEGSTVTDVSPGKVSVARDNNVAVMEDAMKCDKYSNDMEFWYNVFMKAGKFNT